MPRVQSKKKVEVLVYTHPAGAPLANPVSEATPPRVKATGALPRHPKQMPFPSPYHQVNAQHQHYYGRQQQYYGDRAASMHMYGPQQQSWDAAHYYR